MRLTSDDEIREWAKRLLDVRAVEARRLQRIFLYMRDPDPSDRRYWSANGPLRWLPRSTPLEVRRLAEISRVNMMRYVVNASVQRMFVDGYRAEKEAENAKGWDIWQANKMDARQTAIHRPGMAYGASFCTVLPGDPKPVMRPVSPKKMTALFGDDDMWPEIALEKRRSLDPKTTLWRLFDEEEIFWLEMPAQAGIAPGQIKITEREEHQAGRVPVVRFRCQIEDDEEDAILGDIEPLIPLQDQINMTTFGLLVAQHYGAFRQRYILGWIADTEREALQATARKVWMFSDPETKVGEFEQTSLQGYLDSREASLRHLATISQTPAHELLGQLVNLSAEALAMAESSHMRKIGERQIVMGEAHEQALALGVEEDGGQPDPGAYVRWKDTEARSLSQVVDALGKMASLLGIPVSELWERIPGVSQQEVERWKTAAESGDAFAQLNMMLERQATAAASGGLPAPPAPAPLPAGAPA